MPSVVEIRHVTLDDVDAVLALWRLGGPPVDPRSASHCLGPEHGKTDIELVRRSIHGGRRRRRFVGHRAIMARGSDSGRSEQRTVDRLLIGIGEDLAIARVVETPGLGRLGDGLAGLLADVAVDF